MIVVFRGGQPTFQLTTSRRGRQHGVHTGSSTQEDFNSRPHEEVDAQRTRSCKWQSYFNSRPHEEVDRRNGIRGGKHYISTHDLTKRSTWRIALHHTGAVFQLTTSRRGRPDVRAEDPQNGISTHDLTKRSTVSSGTVPSVITFQLTTSRRGRPLGWRSLFSWLYYFNSRPHEEVDWYR